MHKRPVSDTAKIEQLHSYPEAGPLPDEEGENDEVGQEFNAVEAEERASQGSMSSYNSL